MKKAPFNYNPEDYIEFETDSGTHFIPIQEIYKDHRKRWRGKGLYLEGDWVPMNLIDTGDLIKYLRYIQKKEKKDKFDKSKIDLLSWVIRWRNCDPSELPTEYRAVPQQWKLSEINEYNLPEGILELSLLFKLALKLGSKSQILLLHRALKKGGYIYRPGEYIDGEFVPERLEIKSSAFTHDEYMQLKRRGLHEGMQGKI